MGTTSVNPRCYWVCLYPSCRSRAGNRWEQLQYSAFCSHCSHLVPTQNQYVWEQHYPLPHKAYRFIGYSCSHCSHHVLPLSSRTSMKQKSKAPHLVTLCILLAGVTRPLAPLPHQPIPVRSADRPTPSHPYPAALPCAVAASCPCRSADSPLQGTGVRHAWDHAPW